MADMTKTTLDKVIQEQWSEVASVTYRALTVLVPLLDHRWESRLGVGMGDTVNIYGFTQNSAPNNRGAGSGTFGTGATITFDANTEAQTQLVVDRFYYKADRMPVEMEAQVFTSYMQLLAEGRGQAITLQIDADVASDNTNGLDSFSTVVGSDNVDVTEDDLLTLETNLNLQNAPVSERYLVVSPGSRASILKIESARSSLYKDTIGNLTAAKGAGYWGPILTFQAYMSNNLEAGTSGKKNAGFHKEAIAFAEQLKMRTENMLNISAGAFQEHITFNTCGFKVVKSAFGNELDGK